MIYDISPPLVAGIPVWPGDTPFEVTSNLSLKRGDPVELSDIRMSCHTGAHADAPCHTVDGGLTIERMPLEAYLGPCSLHDVRPVDGIIRPADLEASPVALNERVLLRTLAAGSSNDFREDFTSLSVELIEALAKRGVRLIGLDSPSVDRFDSKALPGHAALWHHGIANLEGLALAGVPAGHYELIALPLKLLGRDASPVRAVLRPLIAI